MQDDSRSWTKPVVFMLLIALVYLANGRTLTSGDTIPAQYLPLSLLREFNFDLDEFGFLYEEFIPYYLQYRSGHIISTFPPGPPLLALPVYFLPVVAGISPHSPWLPFLEKLSATCIATLSVLFLYLALEQLTSEQIALVIAIIYALGTPTFSVSSQALWQHGPAQLLLTLTIYFLVRGLREPSFVGIAGLPLMGMVVCRPTDGLIALPILAYIARQHFRESLRFAVFSLPPILFQLGYNRYYFGAFSATGYGPSLADPTSFWWRSSLVDGLLWVLISPHRGLFIYSPILLLSIVGILIVWQQKHPLLQYLSMAPLLVILFYAKLNWWGGWSYGPRYMSDISPLLCLYLYPVLERVQRRKLLNFFIGPLVMVSIVMHLVGAFGYDGSWESALVESLNVNRFWSWSDSPFMHYGRKVGVSAVQKILFLKRSILRLPDSSNASAALSASYEIQDLPTSITSFEPLILSVRASNTGKAVWLANARDDRGMVRMGWRWFKDGQEVAETAGRAAIEYDVFPGEDNIFRVRIWPPLSSGQYTLELGMVSEDVAWFPDLLKRSIHIVSSLDNKMPCDFDALVDRFVKPLDGPPVLNLATDKAMYGVGEVSTLLIGVENKAVPRSLAIYLALHHPNGLVTFLTLAGPRTVNPCQGLWIQYGGGYALWEGHQLEDYPILALRTHHLSPGAYTWYFFLSAPNSYHIVAKAKTTFMIQP